MKAKMLMSKLFYISVIGVSILTLFFVVTCAWIGYEVKSQCQTAVREYKKDCVESLSMLVDDSGQRYRAKNSAIWALGQLGDRRGLEVLQKYYTGDIPDRESLDETISQYELKKAIKLAEGGLNITAMFWRSGVTK